MIFSKFSSNLKKKLYNKNNYNKGFNYINNKPRRSLNN